MLVFISGCTTNGTVSGPSTLPGSGNGVIIEEISVEPEVFDDSDQFQVRMRLRNNGESLATDVQTELSGAASSFNPNLKFPSVMPIDELDGIDFSEGRTEGETKSVTYELTSFNVFKDTSLNIMEVF